MEKFTCICGREFGNIQAFRGHKSHCVKHLESTGRLAIRKQVDFENKKRISKGLKAKYAVDKKLAEEKWKSEKHQCEHCGIIMEIKYGSGRFCSRQCANSRTHSDATKQKMSQSVIESYKRNPPPQKEPPKSFDYGRFIPHEKALLAYNASPKHCSVCEKQLPYEKRHNSTCSKECATVVRKRTIIQTAKRFGGNINPNGVRGTAKYGTYKGIHCDSSWELAYVMYCLDHNINVQRNNDGFEYVYQEEQHIYFPDFIVDGIYIEVKNFHNEQVQCKVSQFPKEKQLTVLFKQDMKKYINYCINTYGKNYAEMYDKDKPSWMDRKSYKEKKTA